MYTGLLIPGEICYKVCRLAMTDPCLADPPGNLLSLVVQRLILMAHTMTVILPRSYWEVYLLTFSKEKRSCFYCQGGS